MNSNSSNENATVDFLVLTALNEERQAVLETLKKVASVEKQDRDGREPLTYYMADVDTNRQDRARYRVVVASMNGMGPIIATADTTRAISRWQPRYVLLVGIAGGVKGETELGQVLIADQIVDYTLAKETIKGKELRYNGQLVDTNLLNATRNLDAAEWMDLLDNMGSDSETSAKMGIGTVLSGGSVIANPKLIKKYSTDWPKMLGVEMEGFAALYAAHSDTTRPGFLMIRGVSDIAEADSQENKEVKEKWRGPAAAVAAAFAVGFLRSGPVPGRSETSALSRNRPIEDRLVGEVSYRRDASPPSVQPSISKERHHTDDGHTNSTVPRTSGWTAPDLFDYVAKLIPPQLDELVVKLHLDPKFLTPNAAGATRAKEIIELCKHRDSQLETLATALKPFFPQLGSPINKDRSRDSLSIRSGSTAVISDGSSAPKTITSGPPGLQTWADLETLSPTFQPNPFEDIVLCMHPDSERAWRGAVPGAQRVRLVHVVITTPPENWHYKHPPGSQQWLDVKKNIDDGIRQIQEAGKKRVHLIARTPFAFAAYLGTKLNPQTYNLVVYNYDNVSPDSKQWRAWGPCWPVRPTVPTNSETFFLPPPGLDLPRHEHGDVALVVNVTGNVAALDTYADSVARYTGSANVDVISLTARKCGQQAISRPIDVEKAADELTTYLQDIPEKLPKMTLHVFYYGPMALLVRASHRLKLRQSPIVFWERVFPPNQPSEWAPAIRFPEGVLLDAE